MITWMLWFNDHQETVGLYRHENTLQWIGDVSLHEVAEKTGGDAVIAVFPTEHVSFVETVLPKTSEKKLRLALPSLVEEAIASNPEDNFYALTQDYKPGETNIIAVMSVAYIKNIVQQCAQANVHITALFPDCFLLPKLAEGLHKMIHGDRIIVRNAEKQGFALEKQHAVLIMQELNDIDAQEPTIQEASPFNFLQAQFLGKAPKKSLGKTEKITIALGGVFAAHLIVLIILGSVLNHRLEALQEESLALYNEVFPGAVKVTSPKSLIERELGTYGAQANAPLTGSLASLSKALAQTPTAELLALEYHQNRLSAQLRLPNMESLDQLTQALSAVGAEAEQEQVTQQDNTVSVRLRIAS